jgi:hypothetical protein
MADGLETDPIVFSSNRGVKKKGGDWVELYYLVKHQLINLVICPHYIRFKSCLDIIWRK